MKALAVKGDSCLKPSPITPVRKTIRQSLGPICLDMRFDRSREISYYSLSAYINSGYASLGTLDSHHQKLRRALRHRSHSAPKAPPPGKFRSEQIQNWARAERAAKSWLRRKLPTLPTAISSKDRMTRRNTSGVVGVHPAYHVIRRRRKTYEYFKWVSRWPGCKLVGGVGWSTNKHGDDEAWVFAVKCRRTENENRE